jgi:hypothetical protein
MVLSKRLLGLVLLVAAVVAASGCGIGRSLVETSEDGAPGGPGGDEVRTADDVRSVDEDVPPPAEDVLPETAAVDVVLVDGGTDAPLPGDGTCVPDCQGKECGADGCGGVCGTCGNGMTCDVTAFQCVPGCSPQCKEGGCGMADGCGGICGCPDGQECFLGSCVEKQGPCAKLDCGPDGQGGSCGECASGEVCADGLCVVPLGPNDCKDIFACFDECPEGDQGCYLGCVEGADPQGQELYDQVMGCLAESGYFDCPPYDDQCYADTFEPCKVIYYQCVQGEASCMDMYTCMAECPGGGPGSDQCYEDCYALGSLEALLQWEGWNNCLYESGYYDCPQWDEECLTKAWEPCALPFKQCVHGDMSCSGIVGCFEDCPPMMDECWLQCYYMGTIDAQFLYDDLYVCLAGVCGANPKPMCRNEALKGECAQPAKACKQD